MIVKKGLIMFVVVSAPLAFGFHANHLIELGGGHSGPLPAPIEAAAAFTCSCGGECPARYICICSGRCSYGDLNTPICRDCMDECCEVACRVEGCPIVVR